MSRVSAYPSRPPTRPSSEQLCDLHVYRVPLDLWRTPLNNILNQSVTDTISLGIIRVPPDLPLIDIRREINGQLEELVPKEYVFLRSVGRSITRLKTKQEYQLKAKHFLPPVHYAPELFILEATPEIREALAISDRSSQQSPSSLHRVSPGGRSYRDGYRSYRDRNGYPGEPHHHGGPDRTSPVHHYSPLPRINPSSPPGPRSRDGSPSDFYNHPRGQGARQQQQQQQPAYYDPQDSDASTRHGYPPPRARPAAHQQDRVGNEATTDKGGSRREDEDEDEEDVRNAGGYSPDKRYKETPNATTATTSPGPGEREQAQAQAQAARHRGASSPPGPDSSDCVTPPSLPPAVDPRHGSPRHSREASPGRTGGAGLSYRAAGPPHGYERDAAYTNRTNEDSGVAGLSPEDQYKNRDKENYYDALNSKSRDLQNRLARDGLALDSDEDERRRLQELEDGAGLDRDRWAADQDDRRRRANTDRQRDEEEERRRREEEEGERRRGEEEEGRRRRREEEAEGEERRRRDEAEEEEKRKGARNEDLNRFPSPPTQRMHSAEMDRDTESARHRRKDEKQKLLEELEDARETRQLTEKEREDLVKKAKNLQNKTQNRRNQARDVWKKRYFEEKKRTPPLEEVTNRLQEELEALHRKMMAALEGPKDKNIKMGGNSVPSQKNNYMIQCTKLQHDIDDMKRRVENAKMKLTAEMKLRNQAEAELRALRAELVQKKINVSLSRSQQWAALGPGMSPAMLKDAQPVPGIIPNGRPATEHEPQSAAA